MIILFKVAVINISVKTLAQMTSTSTFSEFVIKTRCSLLTQHTKQQTEKVST